MLRTWTKPWRNCSAMWRRAFGLMRTGKRCLSRRIQNLEPDRTDRPLWIQTPALNAASRSASDTLTMADALSLMAYGRMRSLPWIMEPQL